MGSKQAWESYPLTFCAREVKTLVSWIRAGQSGSVVGLPGTGKSNMLSFTCHRPDALARHFLMAPDLQPEPFTGKASSAEVTPIKLAVVQVDLNSLTGDDLATFYRVILRSLYEAQAQITAIEPALLNTIQSLYRKVEEKTDPFLPQSALREILLSFRARDARLVLIMDPFDHFCRTAPTIVLDNLRGLRDGFKTTLIYIVGLRYELAYLRDPVEMGELYEILDAHLCWMELLTHDDARYSIGQVEEATAKTFDEEQVERLIELSGGYPALLRMAALCLAQAQLVPDLLAWEDVLLTKLSIQNRLKDIWQALTGEEQAALSVLQSAQAIHTRKERQESLRQFETRYADVLTRLQVKRVCARTDSGWQFFSPLFASFVARQAGTSAGKIWCEPQTERFFQGEKELTSLSERDRRLLQHFVEHPLNRHTIDHLIEAAWADCKSEGVSDAAVQQAIRHLRKQIEPNPAKPAYLITERGNGYRFFPEGAPSR